MKTARSISISKAFGVSFCSKRAIEIAGVTLTPDEDNALVEFYLSHAFPVTTSYRTGIHPQVVANSYHSLKHKVFNLAHLMKSYGNPVDRILGTIVAVEFPPTPAGGWKVQADRAAAPGIRAVAVMHKAAEGVREILYMWDRNEVPMGGDEWTVSMENHHEIAGCGFLVRGSKGVGEFEEGTPDDLRALGFTYVPLGSAPEKLLDCLNNEDDDKKDGSNSTRIKRDFLKQETLLLIGGLNGTIRYQGTGLTPIGAEDEARVSRMLASEGVIDAAAIVQPLHELVERVKNVTGG